MKRFMMWMLAAGFIVSCGLVTGCSKSDEEKAEDVVEDAQDAASDAMDSVKDMAE